MLLLQLCEQVRVWMVNGVKHQVVGRAKVTDQFLLFLPLLPVMLKIERRNARKINKYAPAKKELIKYVTYLHPWYENQMTFYEIKLNVVIDRNPPQTLKHLKSALEEMFEKNRHLNRANVNLVSIEEKKKR